jgi:hypothetical protein
MDRDVDSNLRTASASQCRRRHDASWRRSIVAGRSLIRPVSGRSRVPSNQQASDGCSIVLALFLGIVKVCAELW